MVRGYCILTYASLKIKFLSVAKNDRPLAFYIELMLQLIGGDFYFVSC